MSEPTQLDDTLTEFIRAQRIELRLREVFENPNMDSRLKEDREWNRTARHWSYQLQRRGWIGTDAGQFDLNGFFSQGSAHTKAPTAHDILQCVVSDVLSVENAQDFEDWCSDFGSDPDSRKAERTYNLCKEEAERLRTWLGRERYEQLLYRTDTDR